MDSDHRATPQTAGSLYLVATPIGNLQDISQRAQEVLRKVDLIACEDTRHTRKLLSAYQISTPMTAYHKHNRKQAGTKLIHKLQNGKNIALVSDAGTPGISDPGQDLVAQAISKQIKIVPIPGACAAISALAASGLPTDRFLFVGFLPKKGQAQRKLLRELSSEPGSLVFYESPLRVGKTLSNMADIFGSRQAVVVRELTKVYETVRRDELHSLAEYYKDGTRGEVTLLVAGNTSSQPILGKEIQDLIAALRRGQALGASQIAHLLSGLSAVDKREIYRLASRQDKS